jgi:hypothetical protein
MPSIDARWRQAEDLARPASVAVTVHDGADGGRREVRARSPRPHAADRSKSRRQHGVNAIFETRAENARAPASARSSGTQPKSEVAPPVAPGNEPAAHPLALGPEARRQLLSVGAADETRLDAELLDAVLCLHVRVADAVEVRRACRARPSAPRPADRERQRPPVASPTRPPFARHRLARGVEHTHSSGGVIASRLRVGEGRLPPSIRDPSRPTGARSALGRRFQR